MCSSALQAWSFERSIRLLPRHVYSSRLPSRACGEVACAERWLQQLRLALAAGGSAVGTRVACRPEPLAQWLLVGPGWVWPCALYHPCTCVSVRATPAGLWLCPGQLFFCFGITCLSGAGHPPASVGWATRLRWLAGGRITHRALSLQPNPTPLCRMARVVAAVACDAAVVWCPFGGRAVADHP